MPKIREYGAPSEMQAQRVSGFGDLRPSGMGRVVAQIGETIAETGNAIYRRQAQEEVSNLNAKFTLARTEWAQNIEEQTRSGTLEPEKVREKYQEFVNTMNQDFETSEGRLAFERESAQLGAYVTKNAARGAVQVAGERAVNNYMTSLNTNGNLLQRRPGDFDEVLQSSMRSIDDQVALGALDIKKAEMLKTATGKELSKNALRGIIRQSPAAAKKALDSGTYDKYLDPDTKAQMYNSVESELQSRQAQFLKTLELKQKDPWKFVKKVGDTAGLKPISMGVDAAESFTQRAQYIEDMNKKHGIRLPFLSDDEAEVVASSITSAKPEDAVKLFANVDSQVDDRLKLQFAKPVFEKQPGLSAAMMISGDAPDDAKKVVSGLSLLRNQGDGAGRAIKPPGEANLASEFDSYVGNTLEDANARVATREAITAHMVKTMFDRGQTDFAGFSPDDFKASARAILGPTPEINGRRTLSFRGKSGKFLDDDQLSDLFDSLTDERISAIQGDIPRTMSGEPINMAKSRGRLTLQAVGDGQYFVFRDNMPAWDKNKRPFVLNLKGAEKASFTPEHQTNAVSAYYQMLAGPDSL